MLDMETPGALAGADRRFDREAHASTGSQIIAGKRLVFNPVAAPAATLVDRLTALWIARVSAGSRQRRAPVEHVRNEAKNAL